MASLADLASSIGNLFKSQPQTFDYRSPEKQAQQGPLVAQQTQQSFQLPQVSLPKFDVMAALSGAYNKIFPEDYSGIGKVAQGQMSQGIGGVDSGSMVRGADNSWYIPSWPGSARASEPSNTPTPTPSPSAQPQQASSNFRFAFETLPRDQYYAQNGPRPGFQPQQPPANIGDIIRRIFPNEATSAAAVAATENGQYDPRRADNVNPSDGSIDRGIFQINSNTFNGLMQRQGDRLKKLGIRSFEDMYDPEKNAIVAQIIKEGAQQFRPETNPNGWSGWYGWQDTGYDLNKGWFAPGKRADYEQKKKRSK